MPPAFAAPDVGRWYAQLLPLERSQHGPQDPEAPSPEAPGQVQSLEAPAGEVEVDLQAKPRGGRRRALMALSAAGAAAAAAAFVLSAASTWRAAFGQQQQRLRSDAVAVGASGIVGLSEYTVAYSSDNSCPYDAVGLSETECRKMPDEFGGHLNDPFVITSADDPQGCFGFRHWFYYNLHPVGKSRSERKLYCKRSARPLRFQRISDGTCMLYGFLPIDTAQFCRDAAQELGLADTLVRPTNSSDRPEGCYYFANFVDGTGSLWLSMNAKSSGNGAMTSKDGDAWIRQPLCMAQTTTMPPPPGMTPPARIPSVSRDFLAGNSGANECPYGAVEVNQSECRKMPNRFGGELHNPLVINSPGDPRGCFFFHRWFYYNIHPRGAENVERTPYCKLATGALQHVARSGCGSACNAQMTNVTKRL